MFIDYIFYKKSKIHILYKKLEELERENVSLKVLNNKYELENKNLSHIKNEIEKVVNNFNYRTNNSFETLRRIKDIIN